MILYFSGTGNSKHVAAQLGEKLGEEVKFILDASPAEVRESNTVGFVFPIYSWGVPPLVLNYIHTLPEETVTQWKSKGVVIWAVCTCGDETAMAPEMLTKAFEKRGLSVKGIWSVIMPNNYVLLPGFNVDSKELEQEKISASAQRIDKIAAEISGKDYKVDVVRGSMPRLKTALVYPLFKRWGIFPSRWRVSDACISCGKCASVCGVHNIAMTPSAEADGKLRPVWGDNCVSCLGCFHICPVNAIQYGGATKHKGQYFFKKKK